MPFCSLNHAVKTAPQKKATQDLKYGITKSLGVIAYQMLVARVLDKIFHVVIKLGVLLRRWLHFPA
jgi:hypothetical protein